MLIINNTTQYKTKTGHLADDRVLFLVSKNKQLMVLETDSLPDAKTKGCEPDGVNR